MRGSWFWGLLFCCLNLVYAHSLSLPYGVDINTKDTASLQRGAKWFMNYCAGCHSLQYLRYQRMAEEIGIVDDHGRVYKDLVLQNLIFTGAKIGDPILSAMDKQSATAWFGLPPPDLSLVAKVRGEAWLYAYLMGFYQDDSKLYGTNNQVLPEVAMPNVLEGLQGIRRMRTAEEKRAAPWRPDLEVVAPGELNPAEFRQVIVDLVNFLVYTADPNRGTREFWGKWALAGLFILAILAGLLKREYWRCVKIPR